MDIDNYAFDPFDSKVNIFWMFKDESGIRVTSLPKPPRIGQLKYAINRLDCCDSAGLQRPKLGDALPIYSNSRSIEEPLENSVLIQDFIGGETPGCPLIVRTTPKKRKRTEE